MKNLIIILVAFTFSSCATYNNVCPSNMSTHIPHSGKQYFNKGVHHYYKH